MPPTPRNIPLGDGERVIVMMVSEELAGSCCARCFASTTYIQGLPGLHLLRGCDIAGLLCNDCAYPEAPLLVEGIRFVANGGEWFAAHLRGDQPPNLLYYSAELFKAAELLYKQMEPALSVEMDRHEVHDGGEQ